MKNSIILGKKDVFCIEAELRQMQEYIFINYCLWGKGKMIGDNTVTTLLSSAKRMIKKVLDKKGNRKLSKEISSYSAKDITDYFMDFLWNESSELSNDIGSCNDECLQGFYLFLIEEKGYDWLLIKDENTEAYIDVKIPSNYIYVVFENFLKWIEQSTILVLRSFLEEKRGMH